MFLLFNLDKWPRALSPDDVKGKGVIWGIDLGNQLSKDEGLCACNSEVLYVLVAFISVINH